MSFILREEGVLYIPNISDIGSNGEYPKSHII